MKRIIYAAFIVVSPVVAQAQAQAPTLPLVQQADLVYEGAFRVPPNAAGDDWSFHYGGSALAFDPATQSLFMVGKETLNRVGEFSIPAIRIGAVSTLANAALLQYFTEPTEGTIRLINPADPNNKLIGGLLPAGDRLYVGAYGYYDNTNPPAQPSYFVTNRDFAVQGEVTGPFTVGTIGSGKIGGYSTWIPQEWRAAFGAPALTGQCCIAIVSRTNQGPGISTFDPTDVGVKNPAPSTELLGYPIDHPLGSYNSAYSLYYMGSTKINGVAFPSGTRSVLFFGRHGTTFCYGVGTTNPLLDHQPVPNEPGVIYCYDKEDQSKGPHGYPYSYYVWNYDANDLLAVKGGQKKPWELRPVAVWSLMLPHAATTTQIGGIAYDESTRRVFIAQRRADGTSPLIQVFKVTTPAAPPPPAPPVITSTVLLTGTVGALYEDNLQGTGTGLMTWSVTSGSLPPGLTLTPNSTLISGTPTAEGVFAFTITLSDETSLMVTKDLWIQVDAAPEPPPPDPVPTTTSIHGFRVTTKTCSLWLEDPPPATMLTGGKLQLYRNPGIKQGTAKVSPPWEQSAVVPLGTYKPYAVWTKSGVQTVTRTPVTVECKP